MSEHKGNGEQARQTVQRLRQRELARRREVNTSPSDAAHDKWQNAGWPEVNGQEAAGRPEPGGAFADAVVVLVGALLLVVGALLADAFLVTPLH